MSGWRRLPRAVWALGVVSLLMDLSSETIHALLPTFLSIELGISVVAIGVLDGASEAIASGLKIVSGAWSDRSGRRKRLAVIGYAMSALSKPLFVFANSLWPIAAARAADRVGKGIRGAPRDALIADITAPEHRGAAYGLRQALDTIGAVLGPLCALAWMVGSQNSYRLAFAFAVVPALIAVVVLATAVREPAEHRAKVGKGPVSWRRVRELDRGIWAVLALTALLTIGRTSETFLVLATVARGLSVPNSPLVLVAMNAIYALAAFPSGRLADTMPRVRLFLASGLVLVAAQLVLAQGGSIATSFAGLLLFGLHMALGQGLLSAWIAALAPADLRGTAFGLLHLTTGVAAIVGGVVAGVCWELGGPALTFGVAAGVAIATVLLALVLRRVLTPAA
ncbi:MAG: MFS transporter [Deltaproteobacteria bacterium]|nr:MFS transporter [Deltaproteobacteria bacterium]